MKLLKKDLKEGIITLKIENIQDLWYLVKVVNVGDVVEGRSFRAVKFGDSEERKPVFISLEVEKVDYRQKPLSLRFTGKIVEGRPEEFAPKGKYHSLDISLDYVLTIRKEWKKYELEVIKSAIEDSRKKTVTILLIDEKKALLVDVTPYGFEERFEVTFPSGKKMDQRDFEREKAKKYDEILQALDKKSIIIIAGPGFEKESMRDFLKEKGYNVRMYGCSYAEITGIRELVDRGVIDEVVGEARMQKEAKLVEELLLHVYKEDGLAAYKRVEVDKAIEWSAIDYLLVLDKQILDSSVRELLERAEKSKAKVFIISSDHEWGQKLKGLGGIAAKLRFPLSD
ncbi:MAG: mRNA surveillance protein pelota [Methanobacteriota archaeon]|nr:MAG: mRNA surveillance protein pelota [Euryarchaeota archaeon]